MPREITPSDIYKEDINESTLPYDFYLGSTVIYNNKIHILGASNQTKHYSWNGSSWIEETSIPYQFYQGCAVIYDNKIHILGSYYAYSERNHYSWNGTSWIEESTLPYDFNSGSAVVYNNKIHILGGINNNKRHHSWNGTEWTVESTLPYNFYYGCAVIYDNKIHILGSYSSSNKISHYSWDGSIWKQESTLPYDFYSGSAVVYNNKIHILGSTNSSNKTKHYSWDGTSWTEESILSYDFYSGSAITYNDKIHILGGYAKRTNHYSLEYYIDTNVNKIDFGDENLIDLTEDTLEVSSQLLKDLIAHNKQGNFIKGSRPAYYKTNSSKYAVVCKQEVKSYDGMDDPVIYLGGQYIKLRLTSGATKIQLVSMKSDGVTESILDLATLTSGYTDQFYLKSVKYLNDRCCILQYYNWTSATSHSVYYFRMLSMKTDGTIAMGTANSVLGVATNTSYLDADAWWIRSFLKNCDYPIMLDIATNSTANTARLRGYRAYLNTNTNAIAYATAAIFGHRTAYNSNTELPDQYMAPSRGGAFYKFNGTDTVGICLEYTGSGKAVALADADANGDMAAIGATNHHMLGMTTSGLAVSAKEHDKLYLWFYDNTSTTNLFSKINELDFSDFGKYFINISTLPYNFYYSCSVIYNDKIHILGGYGSSSRKHYSWNGISWVEESTLPYDLSEGCAVIYDNKIHILGSDSLNHYKSHYSWDGTSWIEESTLPCNFTGGAAVVYNNKIHILGGAASSSYYKSHYSWDGTSWTEEVALPYDFYASSAVVYNDKIHILGSYRSGNYTKHYSWDGASWLEESTLPYDFYSGSAVAYDNKIHILGSYVSENRTKYYSWNGISWTKETILPYDFYYGFAIVYNNKIHILGSYSSGNRTKHYSFSSNYFNILSFSNDVLLLDSGRRIQVTPNKLVELEPIEIQYKTCPENRQYIGPESDPWEGIFIYGD